jgi:xylulokinase
MKSRKWSSYLVDLLGLDKNRLAEVCPPGTPLGRLTEKAAVDTGLGINTEIIAGAGDGQAAGLGVNALSSRRAYLNLGTAVVCGIFGDKYLVNKAFRTMYSAADSGFYYECSLRAGSFSIEWFLGNVLGYDRTDKKAQSIVKYFDEKAGQLTPGSNGLFFLPYLSGAMNPLWDKGIRGAFIGLSASHTNADMYRAVLEGIAFEIRFELEAAEQASGAEVDELALIGGGAASNVWRQIIADISGRDLCLMENSEASCLGAAVCAAVGAGLYSSFGDAAAAMTAVKKTVKPDPGRQTLYRRLYQQYKRIYPALKDVYS